MTNALSPGDESAQRRALMLAAQQHELRRLGGLDDVARKDEIVVFRKQPGGDINAYVVNLKSIEEGKLTDPVIVGDDRIVVPKSGAAALGRAIGDVLTGWAIRAPLL